MPEDAEKYRPTEMTSVVDNEMLSLNEFLEMYKKPGVIASTTDAMTQAYVIWAEDEITGEDRFYTHPPCDEAPVEDYMAFMIEFHRLFHLRQSERSKPAKGK